MIVTPPPAPQPVPLETLLSQSWALFRRNWIVALPPFIALVLILAGTVALGAAFGVALYARAGLGHAAPPGGGWFASLFVFIVLVVAVALWSQAAMFGMADAAWAKGTATFGDGFAAFRARGGALLVAFVGLIGLAFVSLILLLPTLGLVLLALPLFTMYVIPSVVSGGRGGFAAIAESFRLVLRFFGTSAIVLLVLLGIRYGLSMLATGPIFPIEMALIPTSTSRIPHLPAIGTLVFAGVWFTLALVVIQAYAGFYTIAIVGLYRSLFAQPGPDRPPGSSAPAVVV